FRAVSASSRASSRYAWSCSRVTSVMAGSELGSVASQYRATGGDLGWFGPGRPGKTTRRGGLPGQGSPGGPPAEGIPMPVVALAQIHPTAVVSPDATIDPNVRIGPYTVVEGPVTIGPDCVVGPYV